MRKSVTAKVIAATFGTLMAASAVVATPQAHADVNFCKDGRVCLWDGTNYEGRAVSYKNPPNVTNIGDYMNDKTTSIWNRTNRDICFFDSVNFGEAPLLIIGAGGSKGNVGPVVNDRITSLRACTGIDG